MSSHVDTTTNLFTEQVGIRGNRVAPRWVPMLLGLCIAAGLLAFQSHGTHRLIATIMAGIMLLVLGLVGRPRVVPRTPNADPRR